MAVQFEDGACLEVVEAEVSTPTMVAELQAGEPASSVLVAGQLRPAHRDALDAAGAGWLDRRGHLRLPSLGIDQPVDDLSAPTPPMQDVWRRASVVAVALALLQREGPVPTTNDLGFYACVTRNAAGRALEDLRSLGLIDEDEEPRRELLLVQLTARWSTRWFGLRTHPDMRELDVEERLVLGVDDDLRRPRWALLDHIDPTVASGRPRLLVADRRALVWMRRRWGAADLTQAAVLVAAAPNPVAVSDRRPGPARPGYPRPTR